MKDYKVIVLGSQCSGKSVLIEYLQENTDYVCIDHDEEIKKRSGGIYPKDHVYVSDVLLPKIESYILDLPSIIYTASFWGLGDNGIDNKRINDAKKAGFKFVNLVTDMNTLLERNKCRITDGKDDASHSLNWYQEVYKNMNKLNQFDLTIDSNESVENMAEKLISFIHSS